MEQKQSTRDVLKSQEGPHSILRSQWNLGFMLKKRQLRKKNSSSLIKMVAATLIIL